MKIIANNGEVTLTKAESYHVLFMYPGGICDVRETDNGVEIFIPHKIERTSNGFKILMEA